MIARGKNSNNLLKIALTASIMTSLSFQKRKRLHNEVKNMYCKDTLSENNVSLPKKLKQIVTLLTDNCQ